MHPDRASWAPLRGAPSRETTPAIGRRRGATILRTDLALVGRTVQPLAPLGGLISVAPVRLLDKKGKVRCSYSLSLLARRTLAVER